MTSPLASLYREPSLLRVQTLMPSESTSNSHSAENAGNETRFRIRNRPIGFMQPLPTKLGIQASQSRCVGE